LLRRFRPSLKAEDQCFSDEAVELLQKHSWPGNIRELANVVEHANILCDEPPIIAEHLPSRFDSRKVANKLRSTGPITLAELELQAIYDALDRNEGSKPRSAEELGISLKTLYNKLNQTILLEKSA
jgi:two-component system NtrC family response regulator